MHVPLMFIFNECITSGFGVVYIMDNMDLSTKQQKETGKPYALSTTQWPTIGKITLSCVI